MKIKTLPASILCASMLACLVLPCSGAAGEQEITLPPKTNGQSLTDKFGRYYEPVTYQLKPAVPSYSLPLKSGQIQNFDKARSWLSNPAASGLLMKNGFATIPWTSNDDVVKAYEAIKKSGTPVFITSDSLLHLYHIQFDETLKRIEEKEFYPDIVKMSRALRDEFYRRYKQGSGDAQEACLRGTAFFTVALKLLDPAADIPSEAKKYVEWELSKIEEHVGFPNAREAEQNAIFTYMEDYSQYVPRGHYTQSENLKRYFKAMMWCGRMTMLIKGDADYGPFSKHALVSPQEAKIQTILAAAISGLASHLTVDNQPLVAKWDRLYSVTAYYVGFADDLTLYDYQDALREVLGSQYRPGQLADDAQLKKFQACLATMRKPAIYSGTGQSGVNLDFEKNRAMTPEQLIRTLDKTQGFRFMGQRYVPDSFILGKLVSPTAGFLRGSPCFTTACIPDVGCVRVFPRGLDVMAVLGSSRSLAVLSKIGDSAYERYDQTYNDLKKQFDAVSAKQWNQNLYWSWLYGLKALIGEQPGAGWPTFTTTDAWKDKQLSAALGSWSSLRHDTILYAKQSYTMSLTSESAPPPKPEFPVVGYVEPAPEFYARLVALTRMTIKGLEDQKVLDTQSRGRLDALDRLLTRLLDISVRELENRKLTQQDYDFIKNFANSLAAIVAGAGASTQKTTMIADVHTDQNTGSVLEEATGYLRLMLVAYKLPEGHILIGAGPVYSYYEFKQPMSDRLTDEKWRDMLNDGKAPGLPEWTGSFGVLK